MKRTRLLALTLFGAAVCLATPASAQEPALWGTSEEIHFHTFSIAAIDPATGESGVAVTTRNPCVGNGVPWVRAGVGAVATQASTRTEYGAELLDRLERGLTAEEALREALSSDERAAFRQIGVIGLEGGSAQHTGEETNPWTGHRSGENYVTQGNVLAGPEVLEAVARSFESTAGSGRHLADRLVAALEAGQAAGGDMRRGRRQSAAVIVADPREGHSRRPDRISTHVNVCEHPTPIAELRRVYDAISQALGYRTLEQFRGRDVVQLKVVLQALGFFRSNVPDGSKAIEEDEDAELYTPELVSAVDAFRTEEGLSTPEHGSPAGLVDEHMVRRLWQRIAEAGKEAEVRERVRALTVVTR
jgi:uncharacterized Ntn-hydrolase superfamily protein